MTGALKNPEIILLGEPENPNSSALIVQTTIDFVYKFVDDQQNFTTSSKEVVVHSCRYPEREKTLYNVSLQNNLFLWGKLGARTVLCGYRVAFHHRAQKVEPDRIAGWVTPCV